MSPSDPPKNPIRSPLLSLWERAKGAFFRKPKNGLIGYERVALCALIGLTMGTLLDALHVRNGAALYKCVPIIPFLNVAFYVPFEFMLAGVVVGTIRPELDEELHRKEKPLSLRFVGLGLAVLTLAWWATGALTDEGAPASAIATLLTLAAAGTWAIFDRTKQGAIAAVIAAFLGVALEAGIVKSGTYQYTHPDLLGTPGPKGIVPQWLPGLYVVACIAVGNMGRFMKYSWDLAFSKKQ